MAGRRLPARRCLLPAGLLFVFLLAACQSQVPVQENIPAVVAGEDLRLMEFMDTYPRGGNLVFLGVAGIRFREQESIDLALEDAARRISIFRNVEGEFQIVSARGGRLLDYRAETRSSLRYDIEAVRFDTHYFDAQYDVLVSENAVFVRVRYPGSLTLAYRPYFQRPGGRPSWVDNPPERIGQYDAGVGFAGRRHAHRDTVTASYENAIFSIILNKYAVAFGQTFAYRGPGFLDVASVVREGVHARGRLNGFYVLETWTDPDDRSVWTLAIARGTVY